MVRMGTVWDRAVEFLSDNAHHLLPVALFAIFLPLSLSGALGGVQQDAGPALIGAITIISIVLPLVMLFGQLAITALALDPALDRDATQVARRRFLPALGMLLLTGVLIAILIVPVPIVLTLTGYGLTEAGAFGPGAAVTVLVALYILLLLPILLYVAARLSVAMPAVVAGAGSVAAIRDSLRLTRRHGLRILGVLLLYAVVVMVVVIATQAVFGSVLQLIIGGPADGLSLAAVLTSVIVGGVSTAFTVLASAFTAKLFLALREQEVLAV